MPPSADPDILEQVRTVLRRDLKLPSDDPLPLDMPFFGGDIDLDSLDMLLLVTSIERQFHVHISDESIGKEAFQSVRSLVDYVQKHRGEAPQSASGKAAEPVDWLSRLPHGSEFRFITRIDQVVPGESASGVWELNGTEPFFAGHFPGNPIVPGVLITEALAQLSGLASAGGASLEGRLAHVDIRFEDAAVPPVVIALSAKAARQMGALRTCEVVAQAGSRVLARGSITLHHREDR